jgi:hypothetical protein
MIPDPEAYNFAGSIKHKNSNVDMFFMAIMY